MRDDPAVRYTVEHFRAIDDEGSPLGVAYVPTGQVDRVVSFGLPGEVFEPRLTTHGFQYVRIDGYDGPLTAEVETYLAPLDRTIAAVRQIMSLPA